MDRAEPLIAAVNDLTITITTQTARYDQLRNERAQLKSSYHQTLFIVENVGMSLWNKRYIRARCTSEDPRALILDYAIATEQQEWNTWNSMLEATEMEMDLRSRKMLLLHSALSKMLIMLNNIQKRLDSAWYRAAWMDIERRGSESPGTDSDLVAWDAYGA